MKLYRSVKDIRWFAFGPTTGWVMFPAEVGGWEQRQPVSGIDPIDLREVPLRMGFNTGIPGAPKSAAGVSKVPLAKIRPNAQPNRKQTGTVSLAYCFKGRVGPRRFQPADNTGWPKSA